MNFRNNLERIAEIYGGIAIFSVDRAEDKPSKVIAGAEVFFAPVS